MGRSCVSLSLPPPPFRSPALSLPHTLLLLLSPQCFAPSLTLLTCLPCVGLSLCSTATSNWMRSSSWTSAWQPRRSLYFEDAGVACHPSRRYAAVLLCAPVPLVTHRCHHRFCRGCLRQHITVGLREARALILDCPQDVWRCRVFWLLAVPLAVTRLPAMRSSV